VEESAQIACEMEGAFRLSWKALGKHCIKEKKKERINK
jgi:hypothetical protein